MFNEYNMETIVPTDKVYATKSEVKRSDVNTKAVLEATEQPSCSSVSISNSSLISKPSQGKSNSKALLEPDQPSCSSVSISNSSLILKPSQRQSNSKTILEPDQPSCSYVSISEISPITKPCQEKRKIKAKSRTTEGSKIITSSPYKDQLEEKLKDKLKTVKAKSVKKNFNKAGPTAEASAAMSEKEKATLCVYCHETYGDTCHDEWIMCIKCGAWMHEECSDNEAGADNYVCDNCR
ncbi:unnamed protein product [Psylliodes chrysocephalus]|uniref:Zinc finger PHD-type domain-containing protein n=1 Tax=Psylliodes chrysocephalus TaxID=3402493 RepID=A0A9P0G5J4_9CUCU|nr:unnamed protein product [Psylliodes chrysocephala]